MGELQEEEKLDWRGILCTDWRRLLYWTVVILFSIVTIKNLTEITLEYLDNPKKADLDIVLNKSMSMPPMTFCFPSGHVLSNIVQNLGENSTVASKEALDKQLQAFNMSDRLVANPWTDDLVFSAFVALAAMHTNEVEIFEDEVAEKLKTFGHSKTWQFGKEKDWENIQFWLDFMKENDIEVDDLIQAVGMRAMMKGLTRFERETHKPQPPTGRSTVPAKMHIEWISFKDFCFRPTFKEDIPIESQGTFFLLTFKFNPNFIVDEDSEDVVPEDECVFIDFHGSRFDREPYMLEGSQRRNGFTEPLCFGSRYEVLLEVRHEYNMIETEDEGEACKEYEDDDENDFTCRSRCRYEHIKGLCQCVPISLADLVENDEDENAKNLTYCNYQKCDIKDDNFDELECTKKCVRDCHQLIYSIKTFQRGRVVMLSPEGKPAVADNVLSMALQFGSFEYLKVEQEYAFTFASFIGEFGGALGMWLGLSILSVLQLFVFMTETATKTVTTRLNVQSIRRNASMKQTQAAALPKKENVSSMPVS
ncbi:unnamed protein product [Bursaphelenchus okinawaensis]|uniref:Uncharacterized protein n=1 Tax=Bursaphelenchus okinawaensis TaxID=465554 RepID=A0A811L1D9_9BILA|nr:unnamed protein product [Bursaphelenchus okinawaensis]CAG9114988.1 unnamed protein product [Bursaphelenchus okinawaensis]